MFCWFLVLLVLLYIVYLIKLDRQQDATEFRITDLSTFEVITNSVMIFNLSSPTKTKAVLVQPVNADGVVVPVVGELSYAIQTPGLVSIFPVGDGSQIILNAIAAGSTDVVVTGQTKSGKTIAATFSIKIAPAIVVVPPVDPLEAVGFLFTDAAESEQ